MAELASFDGTPIAYETVGSGPDVLLLHGFASDRNGNWIAPGIRDAIAASGRRVTAYDARGHGQSGKPHDVAAYDNNAMVRDARFVLDALAIEKVDVVGYSMGAIVASRLVPNEPRARSLVLGGIGGRLARGRSVEGRERLAAALDARAAGGAIKGEPGERPAARAFRRFAERRGTISARWPLFSAPRPPVYRAMWRRSTFRRWSSRASTIDLRGRPPTLPRSSRKRAR